MEQIRVCVFGDELAAGCGDVRGIGWLGRVLARTVAQVPLFTAKLAVPGETSNSVQTHWENDVRLRFRHDTDNRVIISLGIGDLLAGISLARSRLNLANMIDGIDKLGARSLVVGPPPLPGAQPEAIATLSAAWAEVCQRREVPYVETCTPLLGHEQWHGDLSTSALNLPGQAGYGLLAWLVLHQGWHNWIGLPDTEMT